MIYEFTPTQDLHGYDKPWAPGAGKNKAELTDPELTVSTTQRLATLDQTGTFNYVISFDLVNATFEGTSASLLNFVANHSNNYKTPGQIRRISDDAYLNGITQPVTGRFYTVFASLVDPEYVNLYFMSGNYGKWTGQMRNVQLEVGTTPTDFAPYSNICPLTGFNIWNPLAEDYTQVYAGYVNSNTRELLLRPVYPEYSGEELVGPWMSSMDPYDEDATPTEGAFVIDFGGELESFEITPFMLQTLLDSLGIRQHFTNGAGLLNSLMDQAQGRVRSEEELLHLSRPLNVIAIGDQLPAGITFKPISKDVLPGLPGKFIR